MTPRRPRLPQRDVSHDDPGSDWDTHDDDDDDEVGLTEQQETYLDEEALMHGLISDEGEVVGLDDATMALDDPAELLTAVDEREDDVLRWQDVGPAEDAVDPASMLIPEADENGYTREGDALGIEGDSSADTLFAHLDGPSADHDATAGVDLLDGLELPSLPALDQERDDGGALGPEEDTDELADELFVRVPQESEPGGAEP